MARIFIRVVDDEHDQCVDLVGECYWIEIDTESVRKVLSHQWDHIIKARLHPNPFPVSAYRISTPNAAINWETKPRDIPTEEMIILGRLKP